MRTIIAALVLSGVPAFADEPARVDRDGDPLPAGAVARLGTVRLRHSLPVASVSFSGDGKLLASGGYDGAARVWDAVTGKLRTTIVLPGECGVVDAALSPDGRTLATGGNHVSLWEAATGRPLRQLAGDKLRIPGVTVVPLPVPVVFSPDGRMVAAGRGDAVVVWDAETGKRLHVLAEEYKSRVGSYWDAEAGKRVHVLAEEYRARVGSFAFAPDGKSLAIRSRRAEPPERKANIIRCYDLKTGKAVRTMDDPGHPKDAMAFSPDGKTLALVLGPPPGDGRVVLWETATGKEVLAIRGPRWFWSLAFSPDGKGLALGDERGVALWDATTGKEIRRFEDSTGVWLPTFTPDGKRLAAAYRHAVRFWDVATGKEVPVAPGHRSGVTSLCFAEGGKTVVTAGDTTARRWEAVTGKAVDVFRPPVGADGSGNDPFDIKMLISYEPLPAADVAVSPDGKVLAVGSPEDWSIRFWDLPTARMLAEVKRGYGHFGRFIYSADGKLVAWETIAVAPHNTRWWGGAWDLVVGKKLRFPEEGPMVAPLALSPDGRMLTVNLRLWDLRTGRELRKWDREDPLFVATFSPDGKALAAGDRDGNLRVFRADTGAELYHLKGHRKEVRALAYSPDGKRLASGDAGGDVRLWDLATRKEVLRRQAGSGVLALAFDADGRRLATGLWDTTALLWDLPPAARN